MDGAKTVTDTIDNRKVCGRQALCLGRTIFAKEWGPNRDENPGGSRNRVM